MAFDFTSDDHIFYSNKDFAVPAIFQPAGRDPVDVQAVLSVELFGSGNQYVPGVVPEVRKVATLSVADVGKPKQGDILIVDTIDYVIDYIISVDELDVEVLINES